MAVLMIGESPPAYKAAEIPMQCSKQFLAIGDNVVALENGQVVTIGPFAPLWEYIFDFGNGIALAWWDIIKGIIFGVITKTGERLMDIKYNKKGQYKKAFVNGFFVGGVAGGMETFLDETLRVGEGISQPIMAQHEFFQGILVQGAIAGLTNVALTWAKI